MQTDAQWYKDAIIYELHVRSFFDSIGDGMGDFAGLTRKLEYLQDLGINAIWLLPFYPSPLKDDGYDISDYMSIHPQYGTLDSFKHFLDVAHKRGIKVITELVLNHTSDQHPWFQRARRSPVGSVERDFYVWSNTPDRYADVPIVFKDYESSNWTFDSIAQSYYWHRFYSHQPDLNFDNPAVRDAILPIVDFWLGMGVDGLRLDAVPYLFEREGTSCTGLPETHEFLQSLRTHVDSRFPNRMLLAEANVWPEDAVTYFGDGDECHMAFNFPLMPRLFMALFREDRMPIVDILQQTPDIPESCQWALFLRNHDELTLEMVTEEERDAMYRAYARDSHARVNVGIRRRLTPLLSNNRRRIELMNGLLFSLPGSPVIYYGDEIGMGDNIFLGDRNSVRTPMQWSSDRNAGFSRANPQKLFLPITIDPEYHYEAVNVESQQGNSHSLLWWTKRLIDIRKRTQAFSRGTIKFLLPTNRKVVCFLRQHESLIVLVVANLSRFAQYVHLDLSEFEGHTPVELFGGERFPPISKAPYFVSLGPHSFFWFELCASVPVRLCNLSPRQYTDVVSVTVRNMWTEVALRDDDKWEDLLTRFLECRLANDAVPFQIEGVKVRDWVILSGRGNTSETLLLLVDIQSNGDPTTLILPIKMAEGSRAADLLASQSHSIVAKVEGTQTGLLYDAVADADFSLDLADFMVNRRRLRCHNGCELITWMSASCELNKLPSLDSRPRIVGVSKSSVGVVLSDHIVLKILPSIGEGLHPDVEVGRFLAQCGHSNSVIRLRGSLEVVGRRQVPSTVAVLSESVANDGDAWQYTQDMLGVFSERIVTGDPQAQVPEYQKGRNPCEAPSDLPPASPGTPCELLEEYVNMIRTLAVRTAELHLALASDGENPNFAPEPFTGGYQRSLYQAIRGSILNVCDNLQVSAVDLPQSVAQLVKTLLQSRHAILQVLRRLVSHPLMATRIRCHGDFHLGRILMTGTDCVIMDFEGQPALPFSERRIKRSPLRDVATMLCSMEYVSRTALAGLASGGGQIPVRIRTEDLPRIIPWFRYWQSRVSGAFLATYLSHPGVHRLLPPSIDGFHILLDAFRLERCMTDVGRELAQHPDSLSVALETAIDCVRDSISS
ncbi:MAG: maltose alpha-D-glucosyltransferase [Planctomycetaceae bacterium]